MTTAIRQHRPAADGHVGHVLPLLIAAGVLATFLAITWWFWNNARQQASERFQASLRGEAAATSNRIARRMAMYEQMLHGVRGLFASSPAVGRDEFRRYVQELDTERAFPGIKGIGYAEVVPAAEKDAHVARVRAQGFPDYAIQPDSERGMYAPIVFMEPFAGDNLKVFGFDPYAFDIPRAAMEQARDTNTIISAKLRLQQDQDRGDEPGFVMYLPVYRKGSDPTRVENRRQDIIGWVDAPFNMKALMASINGDVPPLIAFRIHDGMDTSRRTQMFSSHPWPDADASGAPLVHLETLSIGGRVWTLIAAPLPGAGLQAKHDLPSFIARAGTAFSLLLACLAWLLAAGRQRALAIARDMTSELRTSEERLRAVIDNAAASIVTIDASGTIESINIAALRIFGYAHDEVTGRNIGMLVPAPHRERHDGYIRNYLQTGQSEIIGKGREVMGVRKDGSQFPMLLVVSEMNINGCRAFTGIIHDITQRKQAEARLEARSALLARANSELLRFAEVSAHHLVEPIRRLGSYAQRLRSHLREVPQAGGDDVRLALDTLEADAARLRTLMRDIERYIAAGLPSEDERRSDGEAVLKSVIGKLSRRIEDAGTRLETSPLPSLPLDRRRLEILLTELLENAITHGRPPDPAIAPCIRISGEPDGHGGRIRIEDNGPGIPPQYRDRVFNIFEKLGAGAGTSTGIGLSIARRIVESCGGGIRVESAPGNGAIVVVEILGGTP